MGQGPIGNKYYPIALLSITITKNGGHLPLSQYNRAMDFMRKTVMVKTNMAYLGDAWCRLGNTLDAEKSMISLKSIFHPQKITLADIQYLIFNKKQQESVQKVKPGNIKANGQNTRLPAQVT